MCESGLSGWMVKACFQAAMAAAVFSAVQSIAMSAQGEGMSIESSRKRLRR